MLTATNTQPFDPLLVNIYRSSPLQMLRLSTTSCQYLWILTAINTMDPISRYLSISMDLYRYKYSASVHYLWTSLWILTVSSTHYLSIFMDPHRYRYSVCWPTTWKYLLTLIAINTLPVDPLLESTYLWILASINTVPYVTLFDY